MSIFKWRKSYETGVSEMDEQHQKLIELINKLYLVMRDGESQSSVVDILQEMDSYAVRHFQDEEKLLQEKGYPEYESHVALHQQYRDKIRELMEASVKEKEQVKETYSFLREWWMDHIVGQDRQYGEFLSGDK